MLFANLTSHRMSRSRATRNLSSCTDGAWRRRRRFPLFTSHRAGVLVEEATLAQLNGQRAAVLARVTGEVTSASAVAEAQRIAYQRYQAEILPLAQQVEVMAEDSYRLGQTGIAALLQALQASRDMRLRSLQTASDFQDALSQLERAIGAPLP